MDVPNDVCYSQSPFISCNTDNNPRMAFKRRHLTADIGKLKSSRCYFNNPVSVNCIIVGFRMLKASTDNLIAFETYSLVSTSRYRN